MLVVGDVMTDVVVLLREQIAKESDTGAAISFAPGGSATNQAVWMARAGLDVTLVAALGEDDAAAAALRVLAAEGVGLNVAQVAGAPTGVVVSIVDLDGRRSMLTDRGANLQLAAVSVPDELFASCGHFHISGYEYFDEQSRDAALALARRAQRAGLTRSVDPSSVGPLAKIGAERFLSWTDGFDLCCANLDEGRLLSGRTEPEDIAAALTAHYRLVALTLGGEGALVSERHGELVRRAARQGRVVDTTGAGDAFTGTFLARWLRRAALDRALADGLEAASRVVGRVGARPAD